MKAAYANGVLSAFEEAGWRPWDALYGVSAGGALVAWAAARQAVWAEATWDYARDPRVLSYARMARGGALLDHDALIDLVYAREHPLDAAAVRASPVPVVVVATDVATGLPHYQDLRGLPDAAVLSWLKATGRLPFAAGPAVRIGGATYLDGGIADPIPVRHAVAEGHADVTLVLNTPAGAASRDNPVLARFVARRHPALREGLLQHHQRKADAIAWAASPPEGVRVRILRPDRPLGLGRLTRDLGRIRGAILRGRADGARFLARERPADGLA